MRFHEFRDDRWPLAYLRLQGNPSQEEFQLYLDDLLAHYQKDGIRSYIVDLKDLSGASPAILKMQTRFFAKHHDLIASRNIGMAIIVANALHRGLLATLLWLRPFPAPHQMVRNLAEAEEYCRGRLQEYGYELP